MASFHSIGQSVGATTLGAVVGSIETPYAALVLGSGNVGGTDALSTGDLQYGDPGEMGAQSVFSVELWFMPTAYPAATRNILIGPKAGGVAFRQWSLNLTAAGAIQCEATDETGTVQTVTSTALVNRNLWNHIFFTVDFNFTGVYVNNVLTSNTNWGNHSVLGLDTSAGATGSRDMRLLGPADNNTQWSFDALAIYRTRLGDARVNEHYRAGTQLGFAAKKVDARLVDVLDVVNHHAPRRFQIGNRTVVERYMSGQSPLEECRHAVEADDIDACFFADAGGTLVFLAANHRLLAPYTTSQATFGDGAGELPYLDYKSDYSSSFTINEWSATRTARGPNTPVTQTRSDAASQSANFRRAQAISDVPVTSDADADTIATGLLLKTKNSFKRVTEITPKTSDPDTSLTVYRRELMDRITVKRRPPGPIGAGPVTQDLYIDRIDMSGTPGVPPSVAFGVSPL